MRGGGYASVFRSGARGVVMMFGLELTTKTEGTEQRVPSRAPPGRRGRKRHVDGVWSGVGAGRGASDRPERHSPVETFRPFRFSRRHSRIPVFDIDSAPGSGSNRRQQNTPHVRPRVVSCCVRGRRGTNEVDARLETENRQPSRYRRYRKTESESRGAGAAAPAGRVPVGSCLSKKPNYRKATHRTLLKGRPSTRIFILVPCFRTTSRGGSSPTRSPQAAQQLHLQCTAASCTQLQPW